MESAAAVVLNVPDDLANQLGRQRELVADEQALNLPEQTLEPALANDRTSECFYRLRRQSEDEPNHQSSLLNSTILLVFVPLLLFVTPQQFAVFVKRCEL